MGGIGSNRWGMRPASVGVESTPSLDIFKLYRDGVLVDGACVKRTWSIYGRQNFFAVLLVNMESDSCIAIGYHIDNTEYIYRIPLYATEPNFGGRRYWFKCPQQGCGRRVAKLHLHHGYFMCRQCGGLTYASKLKNANSRLLWKAQKLHVSLGGSGRMLPINIPPRPKGMHRATYRQKVDRMRYARAKSLNTIWEKYKHRREERLKKLPSDIQAVLNE